MATELLKESDELTQPYEVNNEVLQIRYTLGDHFVHDQYQNEVTRIGMNRHLKARSADVLDELVVACRDSRYIEFTVGHSFNIVQSATAINLFPTWLQPSVAPLIARLGKNISKGAQFWMGMVQERLHNMYHHGKDYPGKPNDTLTWLLDETNEQRAQTPDIVSRLLFLNFAGILSTGLTLLRTIYDLVRHAEYLPALREEIEQAILTHGFTADAFDDMFKLDSFIRESVRLSPLTPHAMLRQVRRDYTFSNGFSVPAGTRIALNQPALNRSETIWSDPLRFDGFRHADKTKPTSRLISTSNSFAGRALAVEEIKATLAHLITNYDFKAADESALIGPPLPIFKLMSWKVSLRKRKV
ncbi:hypothetical protein EW146_g10382 [Bondarzewia mesenterica]|uniref:Cytochrome P450 n=1 Tax=Bondarzewia mesenterica TaxID=1095465 RepID=A0A4S4KYS4_9AGAM|nr:hypothetical protein EW146_g10382 [Bondarzewia mesenterica]